jgi:hypothetical protein
MVRSAIEPVVAIRPEDLLGMDLDPVTSCKLGCFFHVIFFLCLV